MFDQRENLLQDVQHKADVLQAHLIHFRENTDSYSEEALLALQQSLNRFLYPTKTEHKPSHALLRPSDGTARDFRIIRERMQQEVWKNSNMDDILYNGDLLL